MLKTVWIVRWRGFEEECAGRCDALDRWSQLDARGIGAQVFEVRGLGPERCMNLIDTQQFTDASDHGARPSRWRARLRYDGKL